MAGVKKKWQQRAGFLAVHLMIGSSSGHKGEPVPLISGCNRVANRVKVQAGGFKTGEKETGYLF